MLSILWLLLIWSKVIKEIIQGNVIENKFPGAGNSAFQLCVPPTHSQINFVFTMK